MSDSANPILGIVSGFLADVVFRPPLGVWVTGVVVLAAVGVASWYYLIRARSFVNGYTQLSMLILRAAVLACLSWYLAGPGQWVGSESESSSVPVRILVDTSASMAQQDVPTDLVPVRAVGRQTLQKPLLKTPTSGVGLSPDRVSVIGREKPEPVWQEPVKDGWSSRWQAVRVTWLTQSFLDQLRQVTADFRLYRFDEKVESINADRLDDLYPRGSRTALYAAIHQVASHGSRGDDASFPINEDAKDHTQHNHGMPVNDGHSITAELTERRVSELPGKWPEGSRELRIPGIPGGVMVVISDGHDTQRADDPTAATEASRNGWQVMSVPVGTPRSTPDLAVAAWAEADRLLPGQSTWIHATITQTGLERATTRVELWLNDKVIESQDVSFNGRPVVQAKFRVHPQAGRQPGESTSIHAYKVVAQLADMASRFSPIRSTGPNNSSRDSGLSIRDELYVENNKRWVFVETSRQRIKVILFEGQPYWDTRFLSRTLHDDPQVDLTAVYRLSPQQTVTTRSTAGFDNFHTPDSPIISNTLDFPDPARSGSQLGTGMLTGPGSVDDQPYDWDSIDADRLREFDVVILGRDAQYFFPDASAKVLIDFVTHHGGSLVLARGEAFDPSTPAGRRAKQILEPILPVQWGKTVIKHLRLAVTDSGRSHVLTEPEALGDDTVLTRLPDMLAATRIEQEKAASVVLLDQTPYRSNQPMAAVVHMHAGRGRVFAVLGEGLWRWAFLATSQRKYDSVYQSFWSRAIRWLVGGSPFLPGQDLSMELSRLSIEPNQALHVSVSARGGIDEMHNAQPHLTWTDPAGRSTPVPLVRSTQQSSRYMATIHPPSDASLPSDHLEFTDSPIDPMDVTKAADSSHLPGVHQLDLTWTKSSRLDGESSDTFVSGDVTSRRLDPRVSKRFAVYDSSIEKLDPSARPETLAAISRVTGGQCWGIDEPHRLLDYLRMLRQTRRVEPRFEYEWDQPWLVGLIAVLLGLEWWLRRRVGLL